MATKKTVQLPDGGLIKATIKTNTIRMTIEGPTISVMQDIFYSINKPENRAKVIAALQKIDGEMLAHAAKNSVSDS